jgi:hypothetical protein
VKKPPRLLDIAVFGEHFKQIFRRQIAGGEHIIAGNEIVAHMARGGFPAFFGQYTEPQGEILVSNPPFSKRDSIFAKLYEWDMSFAMIMNFNGLFDSKKRADIFREHRVEMLVPRGRMKFCHKDKGQLNSPNFQSIYVCNHLLEDQIVFDDTNF